MSRILIVEDEEDIANLEKDYLELSDFQVEIENRGDQGLKKALQEDFDLVILDLGLPDGDGLDVVKRIREIASTPVIVVSARQEEGEKIRLLDAGADDVLTAPFLMGELLARVRALSRRGPALQPRQLCAGDLTLDRGHCMLRSRGGEIRLSGKEMQIVELFLLHPGQVLPRATLQHKVWGMDNEFAYNNIEVYLSLVRRKLRAIGSAVQIHAERGVGYYLEA